MLDSLQMFVILLIMAARPAWLTSPPAHDDKGRAQVLVQSDVCLSLAEAQSELAQRIASALPAITDPADREALVQARFIESIAVGESLRYRASALVVLADASESKTSLPPWADFFGLGISLLGTGGLVFWLLAPQKKPSSVSESSEKATDLPTESEAVWPGPKEAPLSPRPAAKGESRGLRLACGKETVTIALGSKGRIARDGVLPLAFGDLGDLVWSDSGWRLEFSAYALQQARLGQDRYRKILWNERERKLKSLTEGLIMEPGVLVLSLGSLAEQRIEVLRAEAGRALILKVERGLGSGLEMGGLFAFAHDSLVLGPRPAGDVDIALGLDFLVFRPRSAGGVSVSSRSNTEIRVNNEALGRRALQPGMTLQPGALRILEVF